MAKKVFYQHCNAQFGAAPQVIQTTHGPQGSIHIARCKYCGTEIYVQFFPAEEPNPFPDEAPAPDARLNLLPPAVDLPQVKRPAKKRKAKRRASPS